MKNIAFVGGGTGGHIFPIKSLIEYINNNKNIYKFNDIYRVGENASLEQFIAVKMDDVHFLSIMSGKLRREKTLKSICLNFLDIFKLIIGFFKSIYLLFSRKIDIIFCKGGYVALPFVLAGWIFRKEIYVHESDTVPGLANKIASKFAKTIFTGFPNVMKDSKYVGQILSTTLLDSKNSQNIKMGPNSNLTNVLLIGGSQGAQYIYDSIYDILSKDVTLLDHYCFHIVLGTQNVQMKNKFEKLQNVFSYEFLSQEDMGFLMRNMDIGITRGGATSLAEQKYFNMKLCIIPLPYTGGNHQYHNGKYYEKQYEDTLLSQNSDLKGNLIAYLKENINFKKEKKLNDSIDAKAKILDIITDSTISK